MPVWTITSLTVLLVLAGVVFAYVFYGRAAVPDVHR